jgi:hypothetical protein
MVSLFTTIQLVGDTVTAAANGSVEDFKALSSEMKSN